MIGLAIAKNAFRVYGIDAASEPVRRRGMHRVGALRLIPQLDPVSVGIEVCHMAHYRAHPVAAGRMRSPFVKPCVKSRKNDAPRAEAICDAVRRPAVRFVPVEL